MLYFLSTPKSRKYERFDELNRVLALAKCAHPQWRVEELTEVDVMGRKMPVLAFTMGTTDRSAPTLGLFAGVHGLERVGTHLALTYLEKLSRRMRWDRELRERLERVRIVSIPLINPGGMLLKWRSNPNGVDLMRNAPLDAEIEPSPFVGGQRVTNKLPWYRGEEHQPMERESRALVDYVRREMYGSPVSVALDMHSGYGWRDRIWFPYAKSPRPFPGIQHAWALSALMQETMPNHPYIVEPQSKQYMTHGDLWDFMVDEHAESNMTDKIFIPWTLELGSWRWVTEKPRRQLSALGMFNPLTAGDHRRTMYQNGSLIDFLLAATANPEAWRTRQLTDD